MPFKLHNFNFKLSNQQYNKVDLLKVIVVPICSLSIFLGLCSSLTIYIFIYSLIWLIWLGPLRRNSLSFSQRELHFFRVGSHLPVKQKQVVILLNKMQGILKGEVSLYHWPPVWLIWIQLYDKTFFVFICKTDYSVSQTGGQWYIDTSPLVFPVKRVGHDIQHNYIRDIGLIWHLAMIFSF